MKRIVYRELVSAYLAMINCGKSGNDVWHSRWETVVDRIIYNYLPHGSGIDNGVKISDKTNADRLVLTFGFHFMDENDYYDGWGDYTLTVKASLQFEISLNIVGKNRNGIKEYFYDIFNDALTREIPESEYMAWIKDAGING
jgi:hypothetical protein